MTRNLRIVQTERVDVASRLMSSSVVLRGRFSCLLAVSYNRFYGIMTGMTMFGRISAFINRAVLDA